MCSCPTHWDEWELWYCKLWRDSGEKTPPPPPQIFWVSFSPQNPKPCPFGDHVYDYHHLLMARVWHEFWLVPIPNPNIVG